MSAMVAVDRSKCAANAGTAVRTQNAVTLSQLRQNKEDIVQVKTTGLRTEGRTTGTSSRESGVRSWSKLGSVNLESNRPELTPRISFSSQSFRPVVPARWAVCAGYA